MGVMRASPAIDHVVIGVRDLAAAAVRLETEHGLVAVGGGRHPGWGTANRIVPLGPAYLELVTVVDPDEAAASAFGRWVTRMLDGGPPCGWAVRTDDLDSTAARLGLDATDGSRVSATGELLRWRLAGVERAAADPALPFFIRWDASTALPGTAPAAHPAGEVRLDRLRVDADAAAVSRWLGDAKLPLELTPGTTGVTGLSLTTSRGPATLDLRVPQ
jgi:hypothetical protein